MMSNTKHTPGNWRTRIEDGDEWFFADEQIRVETEDGEFICIMGRNPDMPNDRDANARLIAAAPLMLEALEDAVSAWEDGDLDTAIMSRLRAAIAKATNP